MALQTCFAGVIRQSFHYDETGRLIEVRSDTNPELSEAYRYDGSGNITEKRQGAEVIGMEYDKANQLVSRTDSKGTVDFIYDSAGRMIEEWKGEELLVSYEYGYLDKVILVTRGNEVTKFHYNARGMSMAKERNGKIIETMAWDGIALLSKGDTVYVNEAHISGGIPLMSVTQGENTFYDNDYLGTTTAVYDQEGQADVKLTGSLGSGTDQSEVRFTGKSYDKDLGAHVFPFRNYRSDMGRWASADPAGFPDGPNQHFYAPVPTTSLDPWGLYNDGDWVFKRDSVTNWFEVEDTPTFQLGINSIGSYGWSISGFDSDGYAESLTITLDSSFGLYGFFTTSDAEIEITMDLSINGGTGEVTTTGQNADDDSESNNLLGHAIAAVEYSSDDGTNVYHFQTAYGIGYESIGSFNLGASFGGFGAGVSVGGGNWKRNPKWTNSIQKMEY